ncbi:MAG: cell division protein FtsW [Paracoccaceae bacterium]|nr:MAG: cell division protein FtsW [Paracoccaceae bacterium]
MTDMVFGAVAVHPDEPLLARWWRTVDRWSLAAAAGLFLIGLLLAFAASVPLAERNGLWPYHYVVRQAVFGMVALGAAVVLSMLELREARRLGVLGFLGVLAALALLPVLGTDFGKGAVRWYSLGAISLQPSEFLKPVFAIFCGWLMSASSDPNGPPGRVISLLAAALAAGLLVMQPDFGQAALILGAWGAMYFVSGASPALMLALAGLAVAAARLAYERSAHFASRIDGFLAAEVAENSQLAFALDAIRSGGLFGAGVGEGVVKWRLPDAHTDFIIAVAVEEYGLAMVLGIIALLLVILLRSIRRLMRERDPFVRLAGTGLVTLLGLQALINIGVSIRLLPAKGMTLPFVSYGGSSLLAAGATVGLLLALTRRRPQDELTELLASGRPG